MFSLGKQSLARLKGLKVDLDAVVHVAIANSDTDFSVVEGLRTRARQSELVAAGASQTMNSRHLSGHAVDLAPYIRGELRWDWPLVCKVAEAMQKASIELNIPIVWGAVWDKCMHEYGNPEDEMQAYAARRKALGRRAFLDGPHFELHKGKYP